MDNRNMENMNDHVNQTRVMDKRLRFRRKKEILLLVALLCCLSIITTGTVAYFTAEETAYNVITTGILSLDLVEEQENGEPWPENGVHGILPGMDVDKIVYVVNDGGVDFYTRIGLEMKVTGADGNALSPEGITLDINRTDWTEKDGYYYYNSVLSPLEETEPLFTTVSFDVSLGNEYQNATVVIEVSAQAVQSKNNGDSSLTAVGWSEAVQ